MATVNGENLAPFGPGRGGAVILGQSLAPLTILQQGEARRAVAARAAAVLKARKDAEAAKAIRDNLDYNLGNDPYHGEAIRTRLNAKALDELVAIQKDPTLDDIGKSFAAAAVKQKNNQAAAMATANLPIYNGALTHAYANKAYYDPDKVAIALHNSTTGKLPSEVDAPTIAQQALDSSLNEQGITDELVKNHFPENTLRIEHAGNYGGLHTSNEVKTNGLYRLDSNYDRIKNADGTYAISISPEKLAQLDQGYFKKVIDLDAARYADRQAAGQNLPPIDRAGLIRTRLAAAATYSNRRGEGLNAQLAQHRDSSGKLKAGQATATEASGFNLSTSNPGTDPTVIQRNNYAGVGHSFGKENGPGVDVLVNSKDLTTLGDDKTPSRPNNKSVNSQVKMKATNRQLILTLNGKKYGFDQVRDGQDAYQELGKLVDKLTPEQARKAVAQMVYHGGVTDKAATSGDGRGGRASVIAYKDEDGELMNERDAIAAKARGEIVLPVYDKAETQSAVLHPATQEIDAQVARQTPGFDPRKLTAQQADIVRRLEAKGGRAVTPYYRTPERPHATSAGTYYQPKAPTAAKPTTKPSRSNTGGLY